MLAAQKTFDASHFYAHLDGLHLRTNAHAIWHALLQINIQGSQLGEMQVWRRILQALTPLCQP
jgi:hypothetical protein